MTWLLQVKSNQITGAGNCRTYRQSILLMFQWPPLKGCLPDAWSFTIRPNDLPVGDQRWAQIGDWYDGLASSRTEAPQDIASKSREVTANSGDFKSKIQSVAGFMQREIRYVGIEIGIGGLQPHPAADVFHHRYGDCKDKATLLIAMLNAVGVRATWVYGRYSSGIRRSGVAFPRRKSHDCRD